MKQSGIIQWIRCVFKVITENPWTVIFESEEILSIKMMTVLNNIVTMSTWTDENRNEITFQKGFILKPPINFGQTLESREGQR